MELSLCTTVVFSPTGTSQKIARAVAAGMGLPLRDVNLTHAPASGVTTCAADEVAVVAVPVYGGHVPAPALERMASLQGNHTPAVAIVLYGNRAFDGALQQLAGFLGSRGFVTVAAGAFVGEHSYSTSHYPIAAGRPDADDLAAAREFGGRIYRKLAAAQQPVAVDVSALRTPCNSFFTTLRFVGSVLVASRHSAAQSVPVTDAALCVSCGKCVEVCPMEAIAPGDVLHTDASRCIRCCACVKNCRTGARSYESAFAGPLSRCFAKPKPPVTKV